MGTRKNSSEKQPRWNTKALIGFFIFAFGIYIGALQFGFPVRLLQTDVSGGYDVELITPEPIFDVVDAEYGHVTGPDAFPRIDVYTKGSEEYFVTSGYCDAAVTEGWAHGGMHSFTRDGQYLGKRDVCYDTVPTGPKHCKHDTGCHAHAIIFEYDDGKFVRQLSTPGSQDQVSRSLLSYEVGPSGLDLLGRVFTYNFHTRVKTPGGPGETDRFRSYAVANGVVVTAEVAIGEVLEGGGQRNAFYTLPDLNRFHTIRDQYQYHCPIGQVCSPPVPPGGRPASQWYFEPYVGIGEYFIAYVPKSRHNTNLNEIAVYKMPSESELRNGAEPTKVQVLYTNVTGTGRNLRNIDFEGDKLHFTYEGTRYVYVPGSNGLELVDQRPANPRLRTGTVSKNYDFESGYLVYPKCRTVQNPPRVYPRTRTLCDELVVEKDGVQLTVSPIPLAPDIEYRVGGTINEFEHKSPEDREQAVDSVAISPTGRIMVSTVCTRCGLARSSTPGDTTSYTNETFLYLYEIKDFDGGNGNENINNNHNGNSNHNENGNINDNGNVNSNTNNNGSDYCDSVNDENGDPDDGVRVRGDLEPVPNADWTAETWSTDPVHNIILDPENKTATITVKNTSTTDSYEMELNTYKVFDPGDGSDSQDQPFIETQEPFSHDRVLLGHDGSGESEKSLIVSLPDCGYQVVLYADMFTDDHDTILLPPKFPYQHRLQLLDWNGYHQPLCEGEGGGDGGFTDAIMPPVICPVNGNENSNDNLNGNENDNANGNSNYNDNTNADATDDFLTPPQSPTQFPNDEVPEYASLMFPSIGTTDQYASPIHPETGILYMTLRPLSEGLEVEAFPGHTYTHKVGFYRTESDTWAPFRFEGVEDGSWIRGRAIADISYVSLPEEGEIIAYICESNDDGWLCGYEPVPGVWTLQSYSLSDIPEPPEDDGSHNSNGNENENNNTNDDPDDTGSVCDTCDEIGETECGGGLGFSVLGVDFGTHINRCELVDGCKKWVRAEECSDMCINGLCR